MRGLTAHMALPSPLTPRPDRVFFIVHVLERKACCSNSTER